MQRQAARNRSIDYLRTAGETVDTNGDRRPRMLVFELVAHNHVVGIQQISREFGIASKVGEADGESIDPKSGQQTGPFKGHGACRASHAERNEDTTWWPSPMPFP